LFLWNYCDFFDDFWKRAPILTPARDVFLHFAPLTETNMQV